MNEENKTQDDGYQEIDISKPQKEEPEKDYEVEEEEETEQPKVETKKEEPTEESKEPEELDGINTAGAEKRIRQLIKQRKEREEQLEAQQQQIADFNHNFKTLHKKYKKQKKLV